MANRIRAIACLALVASCGVFPTVVEIGAPPAAADDRAAADESPDKGGDQPTAAGVSYQECDIFNGQVSFCRGWYQGKAVVLRDGSYQECDIFNGQISICHGWYQGEAEVLQDGSYQSCDVFNGQVSFCRGWYKGKAVVRTDR